MNQKATPEVRAKVISDYTKLNIGFGKVIKGYKTLAKVHGIGVALVRKIILQDQKKETNKAPSKKMD